MEGYVGEFVYDNFSVTNNNRILVPSINLSEFTFHLFNPRNEEVSNSVNIKITELGYGHYRIGFLPNISGLWYLIVYHNIYFPWGKAGSYQISEKDRIESLRVFPI